MNIFWPLYLAFAKECRVAEKFIARGRTILWLVFFLLLVQFLNHTSSEKSAAEGILWEITILRLGIGEHLNKFPNPDSQLSKYAVVRLLVQDKIASQFWNFSRHNHSKFKISIQILKMNTPQISNLQPSRTLGRALVNYFQVLILNYGATISGPEKTLGDIFMLAQSSPSARNLACKTSAPNFAPLLFLTFLPHWRPFQLGKSVKERYKLLFFKECV